MVGLPAEDDPATDLPRAYIVANDRSKISEDEVKEFVASRLASYKQLRGKWMGPHTSSLRPLLILFRWCGIRR